MPFTNTADQSIVTYIFGDVSLTPSGTWYVALYTTAPTQSTSGTEVTGGSYARVAVTNNTTNWTAIGSEPSNGYTVQNGIAITFPTSTASWGTVLAVGILTASSGGTLWNYATFTGVAIGSGITPSFAIGALTLTNN